MSPDTRSAKHVVFVAFDGFQLLDLAGPMQVFTTVTEHVRSDISGERIWYHVEIVSTPGGPVMAPGGLTFATRPLPAMLEPGTTLVVVGGDDVGGESANVGLVDWLAAIAPQAERIVPYAMARSFLLERVSWKAGGRRRTGSTATP